MTKALGEGSVFGASASAGGQPGCGDQYPGIEIDQNLDFVLSAIIEKGGVCIDIGEDWSGRHYGPHRPQGFQRYTCINLSLDEAARLSDWLTGAISRLKAVPPTGPVELGCAPNTDEIKNPPEIL